MSSISRTQSNHVTFEYVTEKIIFIPPDGEWGWVIVIVTFVINFIVDGIINTFGIFLEDIAASFNVEPTEVAAVYSIMNAMYLLFRPVSCSLFNRYGFRAVTMFGGVLGSITFFVSTYLKNISYFTIILGFFGGISFNMLFSASLIIVGFYFEKWRAYTTAFALTGGSVGTIFFPIIINKALKGFEWTQKFTILSGLILGAGILTITYVPVKPTKVEIRSYPIDEKQEIVTEPDSTEQSLTITSTSSNVKNCRFLYRMCGKKSNEITTDASEIFRPDNKHLRPSAMNILFNKYSSDNINEPEAEITKIEWESTNFKTNCCGVYFSNYEASKCRPFYRQDTFYVGSLYVLPEYKAAPKMLAPEFVEQPFSASVGYHLSVARKPTYVDLSRRPGISNKILHMLKMMLDPRIIKSPSFLTLTLSGFFTMFGYYIPNVFIMQYGKEIGLNNKWCTLLLTILGISNTMGTLTCGVILCFPIVNIFIVSYLTLFVAGGVMMLSSILDTLTGQIIFVILYGYSITTVLALHSALITNLIGLDCLTNATGISVLCFGIATCIGISLSAYLRKLRGTYKYSFLLAGSSIVLSAILLLIATKLSEWEKKKKNSVN